jgi:hypothetical protein
MIARSADRASDAWRHGVADHSLAWRSRYGAGYKRPDLLPRNGKKLADDGRTGYASLSSYTI